MVLKVSLIIIVLVIVALYTLRIKQLYANSSKLYDTSAKFLTDYYVGDQTQPEITYVALGDSTVQGTGVGKLDHTYPYLVAKALAEKGQYVHVINLGKSGAKAKNLLEEQLPRLEGIKPDYITVTIGTNDATHRTARPDYEQTMQQILEKISGYKTTKTLFATSLDARVFPALQPFYAPIAGYRSKKQNDILRRLMAVHDNITLIDLYEDGKLLYSINPKYYASDLFHPAEAGYALFAKLFAAKL